MAILYSFARLSSFILCFLGLLLSIYSYHVEVAKKSNPNFQALCDLGPRISCSKVFTSRYGKGFGLLEFVVGQNHWLNQPNSLFGIGYYVIQVFLGLQHSARQAGFQVTLSLLSNAGSIYLGYILIYVLEDICVVCISIYTLNFLLLLCNFKKWTFLKSRKTTSAKKKRR